MSQLLSHVTKPRGNQILNLSAGTPAPIPKVEQDRNVGKGESSVVSSADEAESVKRLGTKESVVASTASIGAEELAALVVANRRCRHPGGLGELSDSVLVHTPSKTTLKHGSTFRRRPEFHLEE